MPLINADELDTSPPEYLIDGMVPRTGLGFLHGPSYVGKSLITDNEMALAVANGTPFFGHAAVHGSAVVCLGEGLYDAGVRKQARIARQAQEDVRSVEAVRAQRGDASAEAFAAAMPAYTDERLFVITEPFIVPVSQQGEPTRSLTAAINALKQIPDLELVVLDALSDFVGGLSISNDASASRVISGIKMMVRELDCLVLVIGHDTKDGKAMIGAGRLFNASDFVIAVKPETSGQAGAPKTATITCEKSKYGPEFDPISYTIEPLTWDEPVRDEDGEPVMGVTVPVSTATVRIRETAGAGALRMPGTPRPPRPLPEVRAVPRPRKRNGLRSVASGTLSIVLMSVVLHAALPHHAPVVPKPAATAPACVPITKTVPGKSTLATTVTSTGSYPAATHPVCTAKPRTAARVHHHRLLRGYIAYRIARHVVPYGIRHPFRSSHPVLRHIFHF